MKQLFRKLFQVSFIALLASVSVTASAQLIKAKNEWGKIFRVHHATGTFVLHDLNADTYKAYNLDRAIKPFIPASTFKIANSLIALELGVVKDEFEEFEWDGKTREIKSWNKNHNLRTAMKYSVVPIYQIIAREIGPERMKKALENLNYGNTDISGGIDLFWLNGGLRISAFEQIKFLRRLYKNSLPVSERAQRIVKKIMLTEAKNGYIIRAKTGYAARIEEEVGWWVGWVETDDNCFFFALNMKMDSPKQMKDRITIAREILQSEGILTD